MSPDVRKSRKSATVTNQHSVVGSMVSVWDLLPNLVVTAGQDGRGQGVFKPQRQPHSNRKAMSNMLSRLNRISSQRKSNFDSVPEKNLENCSESVINTIGNMEF